MAVGTRMLQRRATEAVWNTSGYILAEGELGVTLDTGIIKVGDGVNAWNALPVAFDNLYLPILGKAADSELLDGVSADFFVKFADTSVDPEPDSYVQRTADGGVKGTAANADDELTTLAQLNASRLMTTSRTLTGAGTLQLTDSASTVYVNNASTTAQILVTIPPNADVAFPVGTVVHITAWNVGGAKIVPGAGVVLNGAIHVMPKYGAVRLVKVGTNNWDGFSINAGKQLPTIKFRRTAAGDNYGSAYVFVPYDTLDTSETYNPDNEWYTIPGGSMPTARRIVINKDGEYLFNVNFGCNGTGGVTFCQLKQMTADNSHTGSKIRAVQSLNAVCSITVKIRVTAGESFGVAHGFASGNLGKADAEATGGDPSNFKIIRLSD
jgi:hypothetical protein